MKNTDAHATLDDLVISCDSLSLEQIGLVSKLRSYIHQWEKAELTEAKAREVLGDWLLNDYNLRLPGMELSWISSSNTVSINNDLTADQLESIAWWMRNKGNA